MSFQSDESSVELGEVREGFKISHGNTTYRLTSAVKDTVINGETYTSVSVGRGELGVSANSDSKDAILKLPIKHAFCQRYLVPSGPPRVITAEMFRLQMNSGEAVSVWRGRVVSMSVEEHTASFLIPADSTRMMKRRLPVLSVGITCGYSLYDPSCGVDKNSHKVDTTVVSRSGQQVIVASMGGQPNYWAKFGEIIHVPSGESMTIFDHIGTVLTLQYPIFEMQDGDAVTVYAGCAHEIGICRTTFANQLNYGGIPKLPSANPHIGGGYGIFTSE